MIMMGIIFGIVDVFDGNTRCNAILVKIVGGGGKNTYYVCSFSIRCTSMVSYNLEYP